MKYPMLIFIHVKQGDVISNCFGFNPFFIALWCLSLPFLKNCGLLSFFSSLFVFGLEAEGYIKKNIPKPSKSLVDAPVTLIKDRIGKKTAERQHNWKLEIFH